jgi:Dna[CI] antecedent, DciA
MLKLSRVMAEWSPGADGDGPLAAIEAAWSEIVGSHVAQNSYPARIVEKTLVVISRSSAWSHQLTFLGEEILRLIAGRVPDAGVERLRFRVGAQPARRRAIAASVPPAARVQGRLRTDPATCGEALERFRTDVETRGLAKRSAGWRECMLCAALIGPHAGALCAACAAARDDERSAAVTRLVSEAPWLGLAGTAALIDGLEVREYERIRNRLLTRWWAMLAQARAEGRLSRDNRERSIASSYVLLKSGVSPEEIVPATVRSVLGDELMELLYGTTKG